MSREGKIGKLVVERDFWPPLGSMLRMRRQCALLTLSRSNLYYEPKGESAENLQFMEIIRCPAAHARHV